MPVLDTINRAFRDFVRFTGDGKPNAPVGAPLPIGDPRSGLHNLDKAEMRQALIEVAQTQGDPDALQDILTELSGKAEATALDAFKPVLSSLSMGDMFGQHVAVGQALNGATLVAGTGTTVMGIRIPAGQTGAQTYLSLVMNMEAMRGQTIFFRNRFRASAGFLASVTLGPVRAQYSTGSGYTPLEVSAPAAVQRGDMLEISGIATIPGNATQAGLTLQVASANAVTSSVQEAVVSSIEYTILSDRGDEASVQSRFQFVNTGLLPYAEHPTVGSAQALNGAIRVNDERGAGIGINTPVGQTGTSSYVIRLFSAAGLQAGDRLRVTTKYDVSAEFMSRQPLGPVVFNVRTTPNGPGINRTAARRMVQDGTVLTVVSDYVVQGDEYMLGPCIQLAAGGDTSVARNFIAKSLEAMVSRFGESDTTATLQHAMARNRSDIVAAVTRPPVATDLDVGTGGLTFAAAIVASAGASPVTPVRWRVLPGEYTSEFNWTLPKHVEMGASGAVRPRIHYELPDGSALNPASYQPFFVTDTASLRGLDVSVRNGRYAVHIEANGANPDAVIEISDCRLEHLGNVIGSWASQDALGMGTSSGWHVTSKDSVYIAPVMTFAWHNNVDFAKPCVVRNERDTFVALTQSTGSGVNGTALRILPLGSGQRDQHIIEDCVIVGDISYAVTGWFPSELSKQLADHSEIKVSGKGNSPAVFRITDFGRALKIAAPDGSLAPVSVSGPAVAILMGQVRSYPGATNLASYVHGSSDVSEQLVGPAANLAITSLGRRLGNRSSTPVSLSVTVGAETRTVTFNANHTAVSNADLLAQINTALNGIAVASLYAVGERYRPRFTDEELSLTNGQTYGIPMGSLLAWDANRTHVRLMTSSDDPSIFAGVAWEDIYPSKVGRVKAGGYLPISDIRRADTAAITFGSTLSVSPTSPGQAVAGGSQALLTAIRPTAVALRGTA